MVKNSLMPPTTPPTIYQITVAGQLDPQWTGWFDGLTITPKSSGETILTGPVVDQSALYGVLRKIHNLGLPLLAVIRIEPEQGEC